MIKLIASDLDGTLLTDNKELSETTREALDMAIGKGIHMIPSTGRSFKAVPEMIKNYPGVEYVITSNGGAVYSVSRKERIYQCLLEAESVAAVLEMERPDDIVMEIFIRGIPYSEEAYVLDPEKYGATQYGARYVKETRIPIKNIEKFAWEHQEELDSLAFICRDMKVKKAFAKRLEQEIPNIYVTSSVGHLLEIGHKNAGKGNTLLYLMEQLGVKPEEAMAFGDADNDSSMLKAVKYGIAVANGTSECKDAAAFVTDSNEEDGVAKAIYRFCSR